MYLRIWLAVVVAVMVLSVVVGWLWREALDRDREERDGRVAREIVLRNSVGEVVGQAPAEAVRVPGQGLEFRGGDERSGRRSMSSCRAWDDSRWRAESAGHERNFGFLWTLALVAVAVALGAYPIVRRLTKRLETLPPKRRRSLGAGRFATRLPEHGADEVALLSRRFNQAAERVENLLLSHKTLLADASHELRSPLARIRMGLELLGTDPVHARQRREMARSIEELDQLIDEILLATGWTCATPTTPRRSAPPKRSTSWVWRPRSARTGADLDIAPAASSVLVQGHARLLRRVLRNLLENARR